MNPSSEGRPGHHGSSFRTFGAIFAGCGALVIISLLKSSSAVPKQSIPFPLALQEVIPVISKDNSNQDPQHMERDIDDRNNNPVVIPRPPTKSKSRLEQLREACGDLCDTSRPTKPSPAGYFEELTTNVDCKRLFETPLLDTPAEKVVRAIPDDMLNEFTMNGRVPVERWFLKDGYLGKKAKESVWTYRIIEDWKARALNGTFDFGNYYEIDRSTLMEALQVAILVNKTVLVLGSETPWVEALCLAAGAKNITTLEYGSILSEHPQIDTLVPSEFRNRYLAGTLGTFDVVVSYSSLEHSGLGRYGDSLNPWGDIMSLARAWCVTAKNGGLVLGLSSGNDTVYFNAGRIYGSIRYPYMTTNWQRLNYSSDWVDRADEILTWKAPHPRYEGPPGCVIWRNQSSLVYRKTGPEGSDKEALASSIA